MGRNWNRWHASAAYIIDTSGKQPREHAVKFPGCRKVDHYQCVPRSRSRVAPHFALPRTNRKQRGKMSEKPTLTRRYVN